MSIWSLAFCFLAIPQSDPSMEELVRTLGSEKVVEREAAVQKLADLGSPALPALEAASRGGDAEVAQRAGLLVAAIRFWSGSSARFRSTYPDAARRLSAGGRAWLDLFLDAAPPGKVARLEPADLAALVGPAVREARSAAEKTSVAQAIANHDLHAGREAIVAWLGDPEPEVRKAAVEGVAGLHARDLGPRLIPLLDDPEGVAVLEAWEALYALGTPLDPKVLQGHLEGFLSYNPTVASIMIDLGVKEGLPAALEAIRGGDGVVHEGLEVGLDLVLAFEAKEAIPTLLGRAREVEGRDRVIRTLVALEASDAVKSLLDSPDPILLRDTLREAGRLRSPGGAGLVRPHLKSKSPEVQAAAARALGMMGARDAVPDLLQCLTSPDPDVLRAAAFALTELESPEAVPIFKGWLSEKKGPRLYAAVTALWRLGVPEAIPVLQGQLEDPEPLWRAAAVQMLGDARAKAASTAILKRLEDPDYHVRICALRALGKVGNAEAAKVVAALLESKETGVAPAAAQTLGELGAREFRDLLVRCVQTHGPEMIYDCARALERLGAKEIVPVFRTFLREGTARQKETALDVLAVLGGEDLVTEALPLLSDVEPGIRRAAAEYLVSRGRLEGGRGLIAIGGDLNWLNRLRAPGVWKRLQALPAPRFRQGYLRDRALQAARAAGLTLDWTRSLASYAFQGEAGHEGGVEAWDLEDQSESMLDLLWNAANGRLLFVLEEDRIRLIPEARSRVFWSEWLDSVEKKK